ncbi:MAG TPA: XdhC family protein, partial [Ktedonobacterales bacterium]|nr:XdhC family protein [Ktedonobacterales bacterium]
MRAFFQELAASLEQGKTVALATIVRRRGSVPREVGAKMIVHPGGAITGTVGGGCGEAEIWRSALSAIESHCPQSVYVDLTEEIALSSQGVCGGTYEVFVQPWSNAIRPAAIDLPMEQYARAAEAALAANQAAALVTVIHATGAWHAQLGAQMLVCEDGAATGSPGLGTSLEPTIREAALAAMRAGEPGVQEYAGPEGSVAEVFFDPFLPRPELILVGAGHISVPLAQLAASLDFEVTVIDDRASFANKERFPEACQILVAGAEAALRGLRITPRSHLVLVTRAHSHDVEALRAVIDSEAAYIGMIGSQRRIWAVYKLLHDEGVAAEKLTRVRAPIGLDLGGMTPVEIALCIMAEIVMLRRGGTGRPLSDRLRERYQARLAKLDAAEPSADDDLQE